MVSQEDAVAELIARLQRLLKATGTKQDAMAHEIDAYASYDLMDDNKEYEKFPQTLKDVIDSLFMLQHWERGGVRYGRQLAFGPKDIRDLLVRLKELKRSF